MNECARDERKLVYLFLWKFPWNILHFRFISTEYWSNFFFFIISNLMDVLRLQSYKKKWNISFYQKGKKKTSLEVNRIWVKCMCVVTERKVSYRKYFYSKKFCFLRYFVIRSRVCITPHFICNRKATYIVIKHQKKNLWRILQLRYGPIGD